ncbi:Crossover junction endodeoxyribonuclease RuvC [Candidatus Magnetomoraceae bacterium gMMP-15]
MKVIGIDPGLAATGVGMVRGSKLRVEAYSFCTITTSKDLPLPDRLYHIFNEVHKILQDVKPDLMVIEDIFSLKQYPKSGITLGKVSGVILLAGSYMNLPIMEISVKQAKQVLTGSGRADKKQLERAVRHVLNCSSPIKSSHASDALALALIGLTRRNPKLK